MSEHLVRIKLAKGSSIDMHREDTGALKVCHIDQCVSIPEATGKEALELFALLESIGEIKALEFLADEAQSAIDGGLGATDEPD